MQTVIAQREAQTSSLFWWVFWGALTVSGAPAFQEFLYWTFNLSKPQIFTYKTWKLTCLYNAPSFRTPPAWHRGLPGPSGLEPQKSPKRVQKGVPAPPVLGSPRVPKECATSPIRVQKESEDEFLDSFRTPWCTLCRLWGHPGPEAPGHPFVLFSDSFGVPGPKGPGDLCARPGGSQP